MNFKLGFGPVSKELIDILHNYSIENNRFIMLIGSRNQIDFDSGYVTTTNKLIEKIKEKNKNFWICRDHCGPYFLDNELCLSLKSAIENTKKTIATDIENNFDLIHIDSSKCKEKEYEVAEELINFSLKLNPNIKFEFGTEENIGQTIDFDKFRNDITFIKNFPNIEFIVGQTGSLVKGINQVGKFNLTNVKKLVNLCNINNLQFKEHNADYLNKDELLLRKSAGVHALNIAPQLGVVQTKTIFKLSKKYKIDTSDFKKIILDSNKWKKWIYKGSMQEKILSAGHYCYNSVEYIQLKEKLNYFIDVDQELKKEIYKIINLYFD